MIDTMPRCYWCSAKQLITEYTEWGEYTYIGFNKNRDKYSYCVTKRSKNRVPPVSCDVS